MIYAIGDSFTYGDELSNRDSAWPSVLAKFLNQPVVNQGRRATGNTRIVKRVIDNVLENNASMIIIGWSDPLRCEFADHIGVYDLWPGRNYRAFQNDTSHRIDMIKYMTAYNTPEYHFANWLRQIILIQSFCKMHQVECVMFNACVGNEMYQNNQHHLKQHINENQFVGSPVESVQEWVYGTPHGPNGHPLEQGHEIIAEKIYEHIRNKCRLS